MKTRLKILATLLVLTFLLTACATTAPGGSASTSAQQSAPSSASASTEGKYDDSLIEELVSEEGTSQEGTDYEQAYSYHIPQLKDDTAAAKEINASLAKAKELVDGEKQNMADGTSIHLFNISWESAWHDSILSLRMIEEGETDDTSYNTYCYDFATGEAVSLDQVLKSSGADVQKVYQKVYDMIRGYLVTTWMEGNWNGSSAYYADLKTQNLSKETLSPDIMGQNFFWREDGNLEFTLPVASFAGADWYEWKIPVDIQKLGSYDDTSISELYNEEGGYTDPDPNADFADATYFYHLPQLKDNTADAQKINQELAKLGDRIEKAKQALKAGEVPEITGVDWISGWHGSQVSLCVKVAGATVAEYQTYCYDFSTGKAVTLEQVLTDNGTDIQTLIPKVRKAVEEGREVAVSDQYANTYLTADMAFFWPGEVFAWTDSGREVVRKDMIRVLLPAANGSYSTDYWWDNAFDITL